MTRFLDGPAAGVTLQLRRAPYFLRVTDNGTEWDALNNPEDEARPNERLYCYTWKQRPGGMHLLIRGKNKHQGGFFQNGVYGFREEQPSDEIMRDNGKWTQWCGEHVGEYEAFIESTCKPS